jgi:proteic killer suppression protein
MILSFADRQTEDVWNGRFSKRLPKAVQVAARRKLQLIHYAATLEFLRIPPGNRLEALKGDRAGRYSIRINEQWRICFRFDAGNAYEVQILDYH